MPEVQQPTEVLSPTATSATTTTSSSSKSWLLWRTLLQWVSFLFQILLQILRGTPSLAHLALSHLGFRYASLSPPPPSPSFKPLSPDDEDKQSDRHLGQIPPPSDPVISVDDSLHKLTVVLDLDETLVCAYETSSLPDVIRNQAIEAGLKWFELDCISSEKELDGRPKINHVTVFERPGLREFLRKVSEFADLVLFTAGLEGYARPLVDIIDREHRFKLRLYRTSTVTTEYREHVKDLSCLSTDYGRIVIVDNNPFSFLLQPMNGIPCIPFYAGQPHDEQLMGFILPMLKHLSLQKDVRSELYDKFHMPEWFQKHGIPMSEWLGSDLRSAV